MEHLGTMATTAFTSETPTSDRPTDGQNAAPQASSSSKDDVVVFAPALSRVETDKSRVVATIAVSSERRNSEESFEAPTSPSRKHKRLEPKITKNPRKSRFPRHRQITEAHEKLLADAMEGDIDLDDIPKTRELFELGLMKSSILHLMSERWSKELEPPFDAVMAAMSQHGGDSDLKLYLLKDELGPTILDRSHSERTKKAFVEFFFYKYTSEAVELVKSDPELLVFLLSAWRQVDWPHLCSELQTSLPLPMRDEHQNTFLHRVVRYPLGRGRGRADDGDMVETIVRVVVDAAPSTIRVFNSEGKSVYQWCAEALSESYHSPRDMGPSGDEEDGDESDSFGESDDYGGSDDGGQAGRNRNDDDISDQHHAKKVVNLKSNETSTEILRKVSDFLKEQIFRHLDDVEQIKKLIYMEGRDTEIDLDFSLLRHVKLPANKSNEPAALEARQEALRNFFALLKGKKHGVKNIVHLQVDESVDRPCPDTLIESALGGIMIDTLDWKKTDLCASVVVQAVPHVRSLYLYCSGNRGVLRSWAAADGLSSLSDVSFFSLIIFSVSTLPLASY
ncbi:hypothetical protein CONLIGDRAFT_162519 [Coniochaeta ligniaria NRRL 30616]|uniref:Uncharacterized protein n=1 Tax=Coniochaeta ligniaria NRRL 30616 TaxID=1408157 RepID=A0A1J7J0R5_9PEZI|nr:hypothetical protein CONLIGDRAFT_162519 [Coniochaeta ligniaria NRRL 30616]